MRPIHHALVLNLHQPPGNLEQLLAHDEWSAREILFALDRIPRSLWDYEDLARVHLSLSGTLLETLLSPAFQERVFGIVRCGDLLWHLQNTAVIQILGTGYYHPVLPLIPSDDWPAQLERWLGIGRHVFWRTTFPGFWPPELGFCMELIPLLKRLGYRYVLVDSEHVEPLGPMSWDELRYRPHVARHGGEAITVVVRDRTLSDAQESGMDDGWFLSEVRARTRHARYEPLVTTCTDGDNGGWFRNVNQPNNFWGAFYRPLLERARRGDTEVRPVFIDEYLERHGTQGEVRVRTGAWNTGPHHGRDFTQWTGSQAQRAALARVAELSRALHDLEHEAARRRPGDPALEHALEQARYRLLRAQTSCNFFWGEAWVGRSHRDLDDVRRLLDETARGVAGVAPPP